MHADSGARTRHDRPRSKLADTAQKGTPKCA
jgi:hypothetical protein